MRTLSLFVLTLVVLAPAIAQDAPEGAEPGNDWLIYRFPAEPPNLNPIIHRDVYGAYGLYYLNGYLYMLDKEKAELKPELAAAMPEISDDKLVWTIRLRKDAKWHDGQPFTAHDVKFSFDMMMHPKVDSQRTKSYYEDIKTLEAVDDHTVRIIYKQPYYFALYSLYDFPLVPKHCFAGLRDPGDFNTHKFNDWPIGCGPYKMEKWDKGDKIVLVRNEEYFGRKPNIKRIVLKIIQDEAAAVASLKRGEIDLMAVPPASWEKSLKNDGDLLRDYLHYVVYRPFYTYIGWNCGKDIFKDKKVRRALSCLVDVQDFIRTAYYGHGTQVTGPNYFQGEQYNKGVKPLKFDPMEAKKLLEEAGWVDTDDDGVLDKDGKRFDFEFMITTQNPYAEKLATMVKEECKKVGIVVTIRALEWGAFLEELNQDKFDCCTLGWSWDWPENDPYQVWHSSQIAERGSNRVKFKNDEADRLIEEGRKTFDKTKRNAMYHRLHEILYDDQPYTFLLNPEGIVVVHRRFTNVKLDKYPMGANPRAGIEFVVPKGKEKYK